MSNTLTPEDLAAWRSKRTGRPVAAGPMDDAGKPPAMMRSPVDEPQFIIPANAAPDNTPPQVPPSANVPQSNEELEELKQQLAAAHGRLGPTQRQLEEMRATMDAIQRQNAELQARLQEQESAATRLKTQQQLEQFDPFEGMSEEQVAMLDPTAAELIRKATRNAYAKAASQVKDPEEIIRRTLAERDAAQLKKYIQATASATGLTKLANDPRFNKFVAEDDSATLLLNSFMGAADIEIAQSLEPNLRRLIKRFEKTTDSTRNPDPQDQLASHLARAPEAGSSGAKAITSADDVKTITAKARALARAGKHKEANQLLASINN